jgi:hypothetical protein
LVGDRDELRIAQRSAAQVAGEIDEDALAVGVALAEPDMPLDATEAIDEAPGALAGTVRR